MRPRVSLESIKREHKLNAINKLVVRRGSEKALGKAIENIEKRP